MKRAGVRVPTVDCFRQIRQRFPDFHDVGDAFGSKTFIYFSVPILVKIQPADIRVVLLHEFEAILIVVIQAAHLHQRVGVRFGRTVAATSFGT